MFLSCVKRQIYGRIYVRFMVEYKPTTNLFINLDSQPL